MLKNIKGYRFRKCSDINREYPIFELLEGDCILLDISVSDEGIFEIVLHEAVAGKIFNFDDMISILAEGRKLLEDEMK